MKYKYAACPLEVESGERRAESGESRMECIERLRKERPYLQLTQWSVADVDGDPSQCGMSDSPTKVKEVQSIAFQAKESKHLTSADTDIEGLIKELLNEKII